jgi:hypothetical protein
VYIIQSAVRLIESSLFIKSVIVAVLLSFCFAFAKARLKYVDPVAQWEESELKRS